MVTTRSSLTSTSFRAHFTHCFPTFSKLIIPTLKLLYNSITTTTNSSHLPNPNTNPPSFTSIPELQITHASIIKRANYNERFVADQLVTAYAKFGRINDALKLFDEIPSKDIVSWNSIISAFSRNGAVVENCFNLFCRMRRELRLNPNEVTLISVLPVCAEMQTLVEGKCVHVYAVKLGFLADSKVVNSLINMYGKCGSVHDSRRLFERMSCLRNLVTWNTMVAVLVQNGVVEEGVGCFNEMRRVGFQPDRATFVTLLQAFGDLAAMRLGRAVHGFVMCCGFMTDVPVATALISLYSKCGSLEFSYLLFDEMSNPDRVAWTAMLAGYAMHGLGRQAVDWFSLMVKEGVSPDHVTFTHVLNACSHSGLVEEGKRYFESMAQVYGITPRIDHYSCMVDLLGRSGHLEEARELIDRMPMEPTPGVWGALIGACRVTSNIKFGEEVAERLFALDPSDHRNYIILSNIYSAAGQWKDASKMRTLMKERGLRKDPGCSYIEHGGKVHCFVVGDQSHPYSNKIYAKLGELIVKIRKAGYVPNTEFVLHDVDEEMKLDMIYKHSEKLAIVFGLLVSVTGQPIVVTKNLRICGDCHSAAKCISLVEERTIIVRDSKRFHHFVSGLCSCRDYW